MTILNAILQHNCHQYLCIALEITPHRCTHRTLHLSTQSTSIGASIGHDIGHEYRTHESEHHSHRTHCIEAHKVFITTCKNGYICLHIRSPWSHATNQSINLHKNTVKKSIQKYDIFYCKSNLCQRWVANLWFSTFQYLFYRQTNVTIISAIRQHICHQYVCMCV